MRSLSQALQRSATAGRPLPMPWERLRDRGVLFRRGQVSLVAAPPNGGKSLFYMNYAIEAKVPSLILSADQDEVTSFLRAAAIVSGERTSDLEAGLWSKDPAVLAKAKARIHDALQPLDFLRFGFDPSPTRDDIADEVAAFTECWGNSPDLVVVDNLMNIQAEHDNEWGGMRDLMKDFHHIARVSGAHVMVLHHTAEDDKNPYAKPPARKQIQGKVSQLPELILTCVLNPENGEFRLACVKNRSGEHDATGETYMTMFAVPERMRILEDRTKAMLLKNRL